MESITISKPHLCTRMEIWAPKYSTKFGDYGEEVVLLHKRKVGYASPLILIDFTRAKHLAGQRFCVRKQDVERCKVGTNGKAEMYIVRMSQLCTWQTAAEIKEIAFGLFD